jgi:FlaA1/EpsC-like NDP-sugar epimerase
MSMKYLDFKRLTDTVTCEYQLFQRHEAIVIPVQYGNVLLLIGSRGSYI